MSVCADCGFDHEPGENTMCNADGGMAERIDALEAECDRLRKELKLERSATETLLRIDAGRLEELLSLCTELEALKGREVIQRGYVLRDELNDGTSWLRVLRDEAIDFSRQVEMQFMHRVEVIAAEPLAEEKS